MSEPTQTSEPAPARPPPAGVPPALVVAIATMLIAGIGIELVVTYAMKHLGEPRSSWLTQFFFVGRGLLGTGAAFATAVLMLVGLLDLARRAGHGTEGAALRVAAAMAGVILVAVLAGAYAGYWRFPQAEKSEELFESIERFWTWHARMTCAAACTATTALAVAGRRHGVVLAVAVPFLIFTALHYPTRTLREWVSFERPEDAELWLQAAIHIWIRIGFVGTFMATVSAIGTGLPPAPTDMVRAGQGVERVGSGLVARVIVILVTVFTLLMTVGAQSPSMARVAGVIFPTCLLVASIAIVTGMLQAGGLSAHGAPRARLYTGAALTMIAMVIEALKAISIYLALRRGDVEGYAVESVRLTAQALPYLTPALGLAGLLCTLSAAARLRRMAPGARVDESTINSAAASVIIFAACAVALLRWLQSGVSSQGTFVILSIMVAVANIIAQLAVARVCHRVGAAMREVSALPTAVATVK